MTQCGTTVSDQMLLSKLDACPTLAKNERAAVTYAMSRYVELGRLPKSLRDQLHAIAKAKGVLHKTAIKKAKEPATMNIAGDPYSTRTTAGTEYAAKVLANLPKAPPGRRVA